MSSFPEQQPEKQENPLIEPQKATDFSPESPPLEIVSGGAGPLPIEISEEELAFALQNPVSTSGDDTTDEVEIEATPEELEDMTAALHERYPDIQSQIDAFNAANDSPAIDLDKLEAEATTVVDQTTSLGTPATTSEIEDLVSQVRASDDAEPVVVEIPDDGAMSDSDIAALFEQVQAAEPVTPPEPAVPADGGALSESEIAAMFAQSSEPKQAASASDDDAPMSLEEIQNLVLQSENLASVAPAAPTQTIAKSEDSDLKILGVDDLQDMLERGAKLTAPTADLKPLDAEPEPAPVSNIPMVDEDAQFGPFDPPMDGVPLVDECLDVATPESAEWDPEVVARVPMALAVAALALPLRFEDEKLVCLVADPIDHGAIGQISQALHCMVDTRPAPIGDVVKSLRAAYAHADATSARLSMDKAARSRPSLLSLAEKLWKKGA